MINILSIDYYNKITFNQGDSGMICFGSSPYLFEEGDKIIFTIIKDDEVVFTKESSLVDRGLMFLELTSEETKSILIGKYNYMVYAVYYKNLSHEFIINTKELEVNRKEV